MFSSKPIKHVNRVKCIQVCLHVSLELVHTSIRGEKKETLLISFPCHLIKIRGFDRGKTIMQFVRNTSANICARKTECGSWLCANSQGKCSVCTQSNNSINKSTPKSKITVKMSLLLQQRPSVFIHAARSGPAPRRHHRVATNVSRLRRKNISETITELTMFVSPSPTPRTRFPAAGATVTLTSLID